MSIELSTLIRRRSARSRGLSLSGLQSERAILVYQTAAIGMFFRSFSMRTVSDQIRRQDYGSSSGLSRGEKHFSPIGNGYYRVLYSIVRRFRYNPTPRNDIPVGPWSDAFRS